MSKGPTPICPECGSAAVIAVEDGRTCSRCGHVGTAREFTQHSTGIDPDVIQPATGKPHFPRLTDEWCPDDR